MFFLRNGDMKEIFLGVKMSQEYDHSMICQTVKTLLQAQDTQNYKRLAFFSSYHSNRNYVKLKKNKQKKKQVELQRLCKNRQKRQIA